MLSATERKLIYYTSLFIAIIFNISKIVALRQDTFIANYWHFNAFELLLQAALNFAGCIAAAFINLYILFRKLSVFKNIVSLLAANGILLFITAFFGMALQTKLFYAGTNQHMFAGAYTMRLLASQGLMGILLKIIFLLRESRAKDKENEQLRSAYLKAQLTLLQDELNPHFFFNTLSSLSAIVNENPKKAQQYISHLSRVFRYTLAKRDKSLVTLEEELEVFESCAALLKLRLEEGIQVYVDIPQQYFDWQLPYMSLQPLLENVTKHNAAYNDKPLLVKLFIKDNLLIIQNNLQPAGFEVESSGIGLANINERFNILLRRQIEITKTDVFTVKLPIQPV